MPKFDQIYYMKRAFKKAGLRFTPRRDRYNKGCMVAFIGRAWRMQVREGEGNGPDSWWWHSQCGRAFELMYEACRRLREDSASLETEEYACYPERPGERRQRLALAKARAKAEARAKRPAQPLPPIFSWISQELEAKGIAFETRGPYRDEDGVLAVDYRIGEPPTPVTVFENGFVKPPPMMMRIVGAALDGDAAYKSRLKRDAAARRKLAREREGY